MSFQRKLLYIYSSIHIYNTIIQIYIYIYILFKQDYNTIGTIIKMQMAWLTGWQIIW